MKKLFTLSLISLLAACAYNSDGMHQDIEVVTPGARGAVCYLYIDGLRYRVRPPETLNIPKSDENLIVDCLAPGNRRQEAVYEPRLLTGALTSNALNGFTGLIFDYGSNAAYRYPDVVEVDFTNTKIQPVELPAQNNPDIKQPEEYDLEEFLPGDPLLNSDKNKPTIEIQRRQRPGEVASPYADDVHLEESTQDLKTKGDLAKVIESLADDANPSIEPSSGAAIPLYPGE